MMSPLVVLKGSVIVNPGSNSQKEEPFHTLVLSTAQNETGVAIQAVEDETEFVLVRHA